MNDARRDISEQSSEGTPPPDEVFGGRLPIAEALQKLRLRLLDLTARNRLLNFKPTAAKSLPFVEGRLAYVYDRLVESADRRVALQGVPEPKRSEFVERQGRLARPEVADYARQLGISTSFDLAAPTRNEREYQSLRALLYPDDLERHARKLAREAKTAIEETGANMLFLLIGFLEYPEAQGAAKMLLAPLVPVPVSLEKADLDRQTGTYRYSLVYTGEELTENLSLKEKLKQDFNFELPLFTEESSLETYFRGLEQAIQGKPGFRLRQRATLALVSMTKMLLVRDLDPKNWPKLDRRSALTEHEIVQMVFEGKQFDGEDRAGEEYDVDHHKHAELPLIFDADSSQHSALIDVLVGKNLVIEGPPGTGKSQTITNLVASAISSGKKVLFVAEKLAALQVVKSRLTQAGLADFCLELHSNKTSKKDVVESIATRATRRYSRPVQLESLLEALLEKRRALTAYAELINTHSGNAQGLTVHEVLWKAERFRQKSGEAWRKAQSISVERAAEFTRAEFESLHDELARLAHEHERIGTFSSAAPFWGFFPESLPPAAEVDIETALLAATPATQALRERYAAVAELLHADELGMSKEEVRGLAGELAGLAPMAKPDMAEELLPSLFANAHGRGRTSESVLRRLEHHQAKAGELRASFEGKLYAKVQVADETLAAADAVNTGLARVGLRSYSAQALDKLGTECQALAADGQAAIAEFASLAAVACQPFEGSEACIAKVAVPIELSLDCPKEHLHRRVPELGSPGAAAMVFDAKTRYERIHAVRTSLGETFYLDMTVEEKKVEEALLVLREGDEWWRFFQSRHRMAAAFQRSIAKNKKTPRRERREQLEALHGHLKEVRHAREDTRYRRAMGTHWNGEATEFDVLHTLASWLERAQKALLEAQLDVTTFSPLECSVTQVVTLSKAGDRLSQAKTALGACSALFEGGPLKGAAVAKRTFFGERTWHKRLELLDALGKRFCEHAENLGKWGPDTLAAETVVQAARDNHAYWGVVASVDADKEAKHLLGERHNGLETDLQPAFAAHAYGVAVLDLGLPSGINDVLLSQRGEELRKALIKCLGELEAAWTPVEAFFDFLGALGPFELELWAGAKPSDAGFVDGILKRMQSAREGLSGLVPWTQYIQAAHAGRDRGLRAFVDLLESEAIARDVLAAVFGYRLYGTIAEELFKKHRVLGRFSARSHEAIRDEFRKLDREIIELRGKDVAAMAARVAKPPIGTSGGKVAEKTQLNLLEYLFPQTKPRLPIRQMMIQAGRAIQEYKPCFMMGPQAVAQYLAPGALEFDIVVMDEASQLKPEEALGAIARGKQLVVVGDPNQLPPTTFFDKLGETQDDDDGKSQAALLQESILDVCMGHFRPVRTLRWHYRSQHESLIAFSNSRFYRNNLIVFPSPYARNRALGVKCRYVQGATYDSQMNTMEAKVVVEAVLAHMRDRPDESLGVVTLNLKQRDLVDELLDKCMRELKYAEDFCRRHEAEGFGFFVKNLENVQGDERDVIFISTTFGPVPGTGVVYQRFGPISRHDGWRRLNVLFTRARKSLTVFTSMKPEDIVDDDGVPRGTRELRRYLEYLRTGIVADVTGPEGEPESDFEIAVMDALARHDYACTPQFGVAGYRIDLAVKHPQYPNAYLAAIECDGASYHSGRSARDRDRIRQEILERLGWQGRIFRIWSTDWYLNPANEIGRLVSWLNQLRSRPMHEAYLVEPEPDIVAPPTTPVTAAVAIRQQQAPVGSTLESLGVRIDDEEEREVQVGDKVTVAYLGENRERTYTIGTRTDESRGLLYYKAPLADALLGLQEGEIAAMAQPGRASVRFRVVKIEREQQAA